MLKSTRKRPCKDFAAFAFAPSSFVAEPIEEEASSAAALVVVSLHIRFKELHREIHYLPSIL